jgi:hypothetical protein
VGPFRLTRWPALALAAAVAVVLAVAVAVVDRPDTVRRPVAAPTSGPALPPSELAGRWSGAGSLTDCAGLDDGGCPRTRSLTLTVDCAGLPCIVTVVGRSAGTPPLRFEAGRYRTAGLVRAEVAPSCAGEPSSSSRWRLDVVVVDGRLVGSYTESTGQNLNCGATSVAWQVTLER